METPTDSVVAQLRGAIEACDGNTTGIMSLRTPSLVKSPPPNCTSRGEWHLAMAIVNILYLPSCLLREEPSRHWRMADGHSDVSADMRAAYLKIGIEVIMTKILVRSSASLGRDLRGQYLLAVSILTERLNALNDSQSAA